jgi:REP element-mobilizing transposase RayT
LRLFGKVRYQVPIRKRYETVTASKNSLANRLAGRDRGAMPRKPRDTGAGLFHVYTHAVWAAVALFHDDLDRTSFLRRLAKTTVDFGWTCIAYCLMGNHHHLLLRVEQGALPRGMHRLNLGYARDHNTRHGLRGHVQFARYGASRISSDASLLRAYKYVVMNPVEAGLCSHPAEWPWSSYAGSVGLREPDSFVDITSVLDALDVPPDRAIAELRRFIEEA